MLTSGGCALRFTVPASETGSKPMTRLVAKPPIRTAHGPPVETATRMIWTSLSQLLPGAANVLSTRRMVLALAPVERAVMRQTHNDVDGVELLP